MSINGGPARLMRVYGLWIVLVTAVVMVAAYGVGRTAAVEYRSTAIVIVEARVRANTTPLAPDMGTEKQLAQSGLVVEPAALSLGMDPGHLLNGLVISVAPDANVLTFAYTNGDPATAQRRAEALAEAYVAYRNSGEAKEATTAAKKTTTPAPAASTSTQHATLVTPAGLPDKPVSRPVWIDLGIGLVIGLLLGVGSALIRDRLSDRIRGRADFERVAGVTVLATVPRVRRRRRGSQLPITLRAPESPAAESYRYLRSRLQPQLRDGESTILVTSAGEGEGRTTTAANLAAALALSGRSVILVDADLRRPGVHTMFGIDNGIGLAELLAGNATTDDVLRPGPLPQLRLVTAGPAAGNAGDLLEGPRLARTLRALQKLCDVVVVDSAPLLSLSDGIALAAMSDHVLLVGDYRRTTRGFVGRALAELGEVIDGNVSGVLLNAPKSAGGLTPRGREQATAIPVDADDPAVPEVDAAAEPEPGAERGEKDRNAADHNGEKRNGAARNGAERNGAAIAKAIVPKATTAASTVYTSAAAAPVKPTDEPQVPHPRTELERHN